MKAKVQKMYTQFHINESGFQKETFQSGLKDFQLIKNGCMCEYAHTHMRYAQARRLSASHTLFAITAGMYKYSE